MAEAGIDAEAWLLNPVFDARVAHVVARLLQAADVLYERSEHGIAHLPRDCRPAIRAARLIYAEIGRVLERAGCDSINHRTVVSGKRKLGLLAHATGAVLIAPADPSQHFAPLPCTQFLVLAAAHETKPFDAKPRRSLDARLEWGADLFARLAMEDREFMNAQASRGTAISA
jgi:15-cis-phytoene synthase